MNRLMKLVALMTAMMLVLAVAPATAGKADRTKAHVGKTNAAATKVRLDKPSGASRWKKVTKRTKVVLVDRKGRKTLRDRDQLVRGAAVVGSRVRNGRLAVVKIASQRSTGNADCSFDTDEDDDDKVTDDDSFTCSHDYDDDEVETESDCAYESETEGEGGERATEAEWTCSYSEDDSDDALEWECSYGAASERSAEEGEGEVEAELEFECGWEGAGSSPLWACDFAVEALGFTCVSEALGQEFGYTIDPDEMIFTGGMDFTSNAADDAEDGEGVTCADSRVSDYECSIEGERGDGDCEVEWELERSRDGGEGEVAGALSYSCEWGD